MLKRFGFGVVALCTLAAPSQGFAQTVPSAAPQTAAQAPVQKARIGTLLDVEGAVTVTPAGGQAQAAANNMPIYLNDTLNTGDNARAFVLFIDNTNIVLSADANLKIDKYVYDPDDDTSTNNNATYSIQGAFEYVSGLIGHRANPDVHVETPVGSIGIRGTDFWAGPDSDQYSVAVNEGQVSLQTDGGEQLVNKGEGTTVRNRFSRPALAERWSQQRFQRLAQTVRLQHYQSAINRLREIQPRQEGFRQRYTSYVRQSHPHWWHHTARDGQGRHQDNRQDRRQDNRQGRRGMNGTRPDRMDRGRDRMQGGDGGRGRDGWRDRRSGDNMRGGFGSRGGDRMGRNDRQGGLRQDRFGQDRSGGGRFGRERGGGDRDGRVRQKSAALAQSHLESNEYNAKTEAWRKRWQAWQKQNARKYNSQYAQEQNKRWNAWKRANPRRFAQQGKDRHDAGDRNDNLRKDRKDIRHDAGFRRGRL